MYFTQEIRPYFPNWACNRRCFRDKLVTGSFYFLSFAGCPPADFCRICERNMEQTTKTEQTVLSDRPAVEGAAATPVPLNRYQETLRRFDVAATIAIALTALALPFSNSGVIITTCVIAGCWLCSGRWSEKIGMIRSNPVLWLPLLLLALFGVGMFYGPADGANAMERLISYRKLVLPAIIATTLTVPWRRKLALGAFQVGMIVVLGIVIWHNVGILVSGSDERLGSGIRNYITMGLMTILWIVQIYYFTWETRYRWWGLAASLLVMLSLIMFNTSRTVHVVLLVAIVIGLLYRFRWHGVWIGLTVLLLLPTTAYFALPRFQGKIDQVVDQAQAYLEEGNKDTSVGVRLYLYRTSMEMAGQSPLFGAGTGGIPATFKSFNGQPCDDPHNEYLTIYLQLGICGLVVFLAWLVALFRATMRMPSPWGPLVMILLAMIATSCIPNSHISISAEGTMYLFFVGVFFSVLPAKKEINDSVSSRQPAAES